MDLTPAETNAFDSYNKWDSNVITGIDEGYETSIIVVCYYFLSETLFILCLDYLFCRPVILD